MLQIYKHAVSRWYGVGGVSKEGYCFKDVFVVVFDLFSLFGFLACVGFLASRLLGFSASCWFMRRWAFWLYPLHSQFLCGRLRFGCCGFALVYAAFGGFGFPHPLLSQFLSGRFGFCTLSLVFGFGCCIISITSVLSI